MQKIVFVSRLDADCSLGAYTLCKIALRLAEKYPDLEIIMVGGGTEFTQIREKSRKINKKVNQQLIKTVGNTENPSIYFEKSSLFVGVSRAALEAMAYGLPVILFGDEGQLGLLDEKVLPHAKRTNFTCRGACSSASRDGVEVFLFDEICRYFDMAQEEKRHLSELSRATIEKHYSAREMAEKTLKIYRKSIENMQKNGKKIAICGYYGRGNLGDEAILSIVRETIKANIPRARVFVIDNKNPTKIFRALWKSDLFIFGGGSLLQNSTSNKSLFYYLSIIFVANLLSKKSIMLSNGLGPFENNKISRKVTENLVARAAQTFDFISVRDTNSQKLMTSLVPKRKISLVPDPALLFAAKCDYHGEKNAPKKSFLYVPCTNGLQKEFVLASDLAELLKTVGEKYKLQLVIAVLNPKQDLKIAQTVSAFLPTATIFCPQNPRELIERARQSKFVISQRYHGSLFAAIGGSPTISISNDPKMRALCEDFGLFVCQKTSILKRGDEFVSKIERAIEHQDQKSASINRRLLMNASVCREMLDGVIK